MLEPRLLIKQAIKKGLSGVAVTDHNSIKGAVVASCIGKKKDFSVIVGEEIMTDLGEVLCYYLNKEIKPGEYSDVVDKIREQGGVISLSHPYSAGVIRKSALSIAKPADLRRIITTVDAIETFNGRTGMNANEKAFGFARRHRLGSTGGSDAHFAWEVGRGWTKFSGDLSKAIKRKKTKTGGTNKCMTAARVMSLYPKIKNKIKK